MSTAKSRNFRRRTDDVEEEDQPSTAPSTTKPIGTSSSSTKSSTMNKPKKPASKPPVKSLLSFADEEDESPFSRPPPKPTSSRSSSSRFSKSSAHKLTSSKDRSALHALSSVPSNVQPQAGVYTKEALLELQKNTKTLIPPTARNKPKPEAEPVVVLKGLIKPASNESDSIMAGRSHGFDEEKANFDQRLRDSSVERDDTLSRLKEIGLGQGLSEDKEGIPDKATIEAIRAKRERLRQAKAAAPDYIALDGGSNHGAAEGLSDEEPEYRGRIGLFGEKVAGADKKGVFEDFEDRAMPKVRKFEMDSDDEDDEDKMWEEEQVRKGLGKRLDDSVGSQGVGGGVNGVSSIRKSDGLQPSFGYTGAGHSGMYSAVPNVDVAGGYSSIGGTGVDIFSNNVMSLSQQAELAKKGLHENLKGVEESHAKTMASLAKTNEDISSSLLNISYLEKALTDGDNMYRFMQQLRDYVSVICEFLQDKAPFIEELEEQMQKLREERARGISERRVADDDDEISEIEQAISAVRTELRRGGNNAEKVAAAVAASQAAAANARALKSAPVKLDEFGRDENLQKRMEITRRAEARERRRAKADSKRKRTMEKDSSVLHIEGESSTDESDSESAAYKSNQNQLLEVAEKIFSDASDEYSQFSNVVKRFESWKKAYPSSYGNAYISLSIPSVFSPYVRLELLKWDPLHEHKDFMDMEWHSLLFTYGLPEDENTVNGKVDSDADADLIPKLVEKLAIPILHHQLSCCWDMLSTSETKHAVFAMNLVIGYVDLSSSALMGLLSVLRDRLTKAVADLIVPTWSPLEMQAVPNATRVAAYRFGMSVRLMRNICLWKEILSMPVLEKIVLDDLLCNKILPHLHSIHSNIHDAILRTERVVASLLGVWTGLGATGDRSRKLQPLVDYLLLIGKTLERKQISSSMETETGKLVRRLKKMLVQLNEYDHARAVSRTFNLKEAL
ncbi:transcriptional repressor ILP1 [Andrographis paniculata]|uniref:transcriptional repressor ILP1 n=1 Tax=Andrographis paniculata TaxID=175694 RepID=UPI0021E7D692|nr:transcriptional repressor ILP1 [Andrographis paniculata]XP_051148714.1 transcriptional repressor ILP1 [Andrographis paniculata]XP_051148715.1 transcriptional repressor ILP1 [Andrographis paniculata]